MVGVRHLVLSPAANPQLFLKKERRITGKAGKYLFEIQLFSGGSAEFAQ
jgi:hypothetical protein